MRKTVLAAAAGLAAGLCVALPAVSSGASSPAASPPSLPYPTCFGTVPKTLEVNIAGHIASECLGPGGDTATVDQGVGVYWSDNLYALHYNWHPGHGEMLVQEIFAKSCHEVSLERHGAACGLYANVPTTDTTPGSDSYANGRIIWLPDGCLVAAPTDLHAPPVTCSAVVLNGGATVTAGRPMTAVEAESVADYWTVMDRYTPGEYW